MKIRFSLIYSYIFLIIFGLIKCKPCPTCCNLEVPCSECPEQCKINSIGRKFNNIIILLDLSDRINDRNQKARDIKIIKNIYSEYISQIKSKEICKNCGLSKAKDRIKIVLASQSSTNILKNKYEPLLREDYMEISDSSKSKYVKQRENDFEKYTQMLYNELITPIGSKFSDFFYILCNDNLISDTAEFVNKIIVLTDGERDNIKDESFPNNCSLRNYELFFVEFTNENNTSLELSNKEYIFNKYLETAVNQRPVYLPNKITENDIVNRIFNTRIKTGPANIPSGGKNPPPQPPTRPTEEPIDDEFKSDKSAMRLDLTIDPLKLNIHGLPDGTYKVEIRENSILHDYTSTSIDSEMRILFYNSYFTIPKVKIEAIKDRGTNKNISFKIN